MDGDYDLIILGGGIAGMTAAIYGARANLKILLLEKRVCGGLVNTTHVVENFPSYPSINGMDLMEKVRHHVDTLKVEVREVIEIDDLDLTGEIKTISTDEGCFRAPTAILATGRKPKELPLAADFEQIHYCAICDGGAYKGKKVLVIGGGNSGVEESLYLLTLGVDHIFLIEELDRLTAGKGALNRLAACPNVEIMPRTRLTGVHGEKRLASVDLLQISTNTRLEKNVDGIFVYMGQEPQTHLFQKQIKLDESGYIQTDSDMKTNLPGVFAAGDVIRKKYRQITTAMGDATVAALSAISHLNEKRECRF